MALHQLINILGGAWRLSKLDPAAEFPDEQIMPDQIRYHRALVRGGWIGAVIGVPLAVWTAYEFYAHPNKSEPDGRAVMMTFVLAPLMMFLLGIVGGVSWTAIFVPGSFFSGPVGAHWMKLAGTKGPRSTRVLAVVTSLLAVGIVIFLAICARLGKV